MDTDSSAFSIFVLLLFIIVCYFVFSKVKKSILTKIAISWIITISICICLMFIVGLLEEGIIGWILLCLVIYGIYYQFESGKFSSNSNKYNNSNSNMKEYQIRINLENNPPNNFNSKFDDFNAESILHSLGYRVGKSGLSKFERQRLLKKIIDEGYLTKQDIIETLERNISLFQNRSNFVQSIKDWKEDIYFVKNDI